MKKKARTMNEALEMVAVAPDRFRLVFGEFEMALAARRGGGGKAADEEEGEGGKGWRTAGVR
jgi:hypothetical protein